MEPVSLTVPVPANVRVRVVGAGVVSESAGALLVPVTGPLRFSVVPRFAATVELLDSVTGPLRVPLPTDWTIAPLPPVPAPVNLIGALLLMPVTPNCKVPPPVTIPDVEPKAAAFVRFSTPLDTVVVPS